MFQLCYARMYVCWCMVGLYRNRIAGDGGCPGIGKAAVSSFPSACEGFDLKSSRMVLITASV